LIKTKKNILFLQVQNGSGKTTILRECKKYFEQLLEIPLSELFTVKTRKEILESTVYNFKLFFNVEKLTSLRLAYESGVFIVKYLDTNSGENGYRGLNFDIETKYDKVDLPFVNRINENLANKMMAYLIDLDYSRLRAFREGEKETYEKIDKWFENFLKILQDINEKVIDFKYSSEHKVFVMKIKNENKIIDVKFNEMPDGFKAIFKIVFEIILQMENKVDLIYEIPGIVLIDEPELFLHINLQKKIMPYLSKLFPNIQFIVATHSPFILSSLDNAVVYDLEKNIRVENLSGYSSSGLVETYFENDKYSNLVKEKLNEYEKAIADYSKIIEKYPNISHQDYFRRANCYRNFKKYDEALADFNKVIELNSNDSRYYLNRANSRYYSDRADCYKHLGQYQEALNDFDKALEIYFEYNKKDIFREDYLDLLFRVFSFLF